MMLNMSKNEFCVSNFWRKIGRQTAVGKSTAALTLMGDGLRREERDVR